MTKRVIRNVTKRPRKEPPVIPKQAPKVEPRPDPQPSPVNVSATWIEAVERLELPEPVVESVTPPEDLFDPPPEPVPEPIRRGVPMPDEPLAAPRESPWLHHRPLIFAGFVIGLIVWFSVAHTPRVDIYAKVEKPTQPVRERPQTRREFCQELMGRGGTCDATVRLVPDFPSQEQADEWRKQVITREAERLRREYEQVMTLRCASTFSVEYFDDCRKWEKARRSSIPELQGIY